MRKDKIDANPVLKFAFEFALDIIAYCELLEEKKKFVVSRQLLKAGTSIGANAIEAQNAESRQDFFHKFKIAAKEGEESEYWLLLCKYSKEYPDPGILLNKAESLNNIIGKILTTSKLSLIKSSH